MRPRIRLFPSRSLWYWVGPTNLSLGSVKSCFEGRAKVLIRQGPGHIRHTYIRMGETLVRIRQPGRNDDAARPVDPEKERAPRWWGEFCSPGFPSPTQDACGPHGGNEHTRR